MREVTSDGPGEEVVLGSFRGVRFVTPEGWVVFFPGHGVVHVPDKSGVWLADPRRLLTEG